MSDILENLNDEQLAAVTHSAGPLLIVAGAGTGKTTVVTKRIAHLIQEKGIDSEGILSLTFTDKAANEMEERVDRLLPLGYFDLWIHTFHGFGEKILRAHGLDIGLPGGFRLFNEFEQWSLVRKHLDLFPLSYYRPLGNPTKFISALLKHFSRAKDEDISPLAYQSYVDGLRRKYAAGEKLFGDDFNQAETEQEIERLSEIASSYAVYEKLLLDEGALDFGDLINYTLKLFRERPRILNRYRQQFKHILVDEFQDTNWAQYELVKLLAAPRNNLVVVGDDDQSIYKFRGASVSNILQFKDDFPNAKEIFLNRNYRNRQGILDLAYEFIQANNPDRLEYQLKVKSGSNSLDKKLLAAREGEARIDVLRGTDLANEVSLVVSKIGELAQDPETDWNDFCILVRANDSAAVFCQALESASIPYIFLASRGLYSKPVIMDILAWFRLLDDYHEGTAVYRALCMPPFSFSQRAVVQYNYIAGRKAWSLYETIKETRIDAETDRLAARFLELIDRHTALARQHSASEMLLCFLEDSGYTKIITSQSETDCREQTLQINAFLRRIKQFEEANDDKSIRAFLIEIRMEMDAGDSGTLSPDAEAGPELVKVMTAHAAKGLEFKHVFLVNLVDKRFPTIERSEAISLPDDLIKERLPVGDAHLQEERRLFYVAATRAKDSLFLTWSPDYGGARRKKPSQFLLECGLVAGDDISEEKKTEKQESGTLPVRTGKVTPLMQVYKLPPYLSYTQIAAFSNCPYQYRFAHILKIPRRGKYQFSFGKTLHSTLQKLFQALANQRQIAKPNLFNTDNASQKKPALDLAEILAMYDESWVDDWFASKEAKAEYYERGKEILKVFHQKHAENWPNAVHLEKGFSNKIKADGEVYTIRGAIDRVDDLGDSLRIVDYKTGNPKDKLTFEEKEQLFIYQLAASSLFDKPVSSLCFYYLENNTPIEFIGSEKDLEKMEAKIVSVIEEINKGDFSARPSPLCAFCDFKDICEFKK